MSTEISPLAPMTNFARYSRAIMLGRGDLSHAIGVARQWPKCARVAATLEYEKKIREGVVEIERAEVPPMTSLSPNSSALIEYGIGPTVSGAIRARTILEPLQPLMMAVGFHIDVPVVMQGPTADFVGEGDAISFMMGSQTKVRFEHYKVQGGAVFSNELIRYSSFAIDQYISNTLLAAMAAGLDNRMLDPYYTGSVGRNPASLTHSGVIITSTGSTGTQVANDLQSMRNAWVPRNDGINGRWIMKPSTAMYLSFLTNAIGAYVFPGLTAQGGTLMGLPVICSSNSPKQICLLDPSDCAIADEDEVELAYASHASLLMTDNAQASPVTTAVQSLWARNESACRVTKYINYQRLHPATAVTMVVNY